MIPPPRFLWRTSLRAFLEDHEPVKHFGVGRRLFDPFLGGAAGTRRRDDDVVTRLPIGGRRYLVFVGHLHGHEQPFEDCDGYPVDFPGSVSLKRFLMKSSSDCSVSA